MKLISNPKKSTKSVDQKPTQQPIINNKSAFPALKVHQGLKFSDWFSQAHSTQPVDQISSKQTEHQDESLFSPQQLLDLTTELITNLKSCRTKLDQFQVITKLAIKYVNYD